MLNDILCPFLEGIKDACIAFLIEVSIILRKRQSAILIFILIKAGLIVLFYPTVSDWMAKQDHMESVIHYDTVSLKKEGGEILSRLEEAQIYNRALTGQAIEDPFIPGSGMMVPENYDSILDIADGMMGYIQIPAIEVKLPIYHGTSSEVLEKGVGHMNMTAFPVGGEGNHAVLTGHTALPGARLLSGLINLKKGNVFYITILSQTLAYEVDQIKVVKPNETNDLRPAAGEDYVTLITCTPYAVNSHRLLVRGSRIAYTPEMEKTIEDVAVGSHYSYDTIIAVTALIIIILIEAALFINKRRRRIKGR